MRRKKLTDYLFIVCAAANRAVFNAALLPSGVGKRKLPFGQTEESFKLIVLG